LCLEKEQNYYANSVYFISLQFLSRAYGLLNQNDIKINRSRMDAGSYAKEIIEVVAAKSKLFYIRANKSADLSLQISKIKQWKTVEIN
jgi:hypothetical protein